MARTKKPSDPTDYTQIKEFSFGARNRERHSEASPTR